MRNTEASDPLSWERKVAAFGFYLADMDEESLERSLIAIGKEPGRIYFPTPGEILNVLDRFRKEQISTAGDKAWDQIQAYMAKWGCPAKEQSRIEAGEIVTERPPVLDAEMKHAIAAAGGYDALYYVGIEHAHFARSRFTEAFTRRFEQQTRELLSPGDAIKALAAIPIVKTAKP